jgi:hypothetical protein
MAGQRIASFTVDPGFSAFRGEPMPAGMLRIETTVGNPNLLPNHLPVHLVAVPARRPNRSSRMSGHQQPILSSYRGIRRAAGRYHPFPPAPLPSPAGRRHQLGRPWDRRRPPHTRSGPPHHQPRLPAPRPAFAIFLRACGRPSVEPQQRHDKRENR